MKVTVLSENTSACGLPSEHGLSLYVETNGRKLLFDTGQGDLFARNAEVLGVDLSAVGLAVISHGHYDHGGGLKTFLSLNDSAPVYLSRYAFEPHFNSERYNGLDVTLAHSDRLILTDGVTELGDGLTLYSCIKPKAITSNASTGLFMEQNGELLPDDFRHEHYLMIEENGRRVLFSGCSHRGAINIVDRFMPDVMIGGFHYFRLGLDDRLKGFAQRLDSYPTQYYTCHCTGVEQYGFMKPFMRRLSYISTGDSITI